MKFNGFKVSKCKELVTIYMTENFANILIKKFLFQIILDQKIYKILTVWQYVSPQIFIKIKLF